MQRMRRQQPATRLGPKVIEAEVDARHLDAAEVCRCGSQPRVQLYHRKGLLVGEVGKHERGTHQRFRIRAHHRTLLGLRSLKHLACARHAHLRHRRVQACAVDLRHMLVAVCCKRWRCQHITALLVMREQLCARQRCSSRCPPWIKFSVRNLLQRRRAATEARDARLQQREDGEIVVARVRKADDGHARLAAQRLRDAAREERFRHGGAQTNERQAEDARNLNGAAGRRFDGTCKLILCERPRPHAAVALHEAHFSAQHVLQHRVALLHVFTEAVQSAFHERGAHEHGKR
jgi:hypothetical protein